MSGTYDQLRQALARAASCFNAGEYDQALRVLNEISSGGVDFPAALVMRARLLQLMPAQESVGVTASLDEVQDALTRACLLAPRDPEPLTELGYFQYAVLDRPEAALQQFQKAVELAEEQYVAGCVGMAKCLLDLGETERAQQVVRDLRNAFPDRLFLEPSEFDLPD